MCLECESTECLFYRGEDSDNGKARDPTPASEDYGSFDSWDEEIYNEAVTSRYETTGRSLLLESTTCPECVDSTVFQLAKAARKSIGLEDSQPAIDFAESYEDEGQDTLSIQTATFPSSSSTSDIQTVLTFADDIGATKPKRRRGRPRKQAAISAISSVESKGYSDNDSQTPPVNSVENDSSIPQKTIPSGSPQTREEVGTSEAADLEINSQDSAVDELPSKGSKVNIEFEVPAFADRAPSPPQPMLGGKRRRVPYLESEGIPSSTIEDDTRDKLLPLRFSEAENLTGSMLDTYKREHRLSVTDVSAPTYCELQYFYKYYLKDFTRTAAMKKGTKIHDNLEKETTKKVVADLENMTREDKSAIEFINMLLQLQSMTQKADSGEEVALTREFRVFGYFGDIFINGVIDELSYLNSRLNQEGIEFIDADPKTTKEHIIEVPHNNIAQETTTLAELYPALESLGTASAGKQSSILSYLKGVDANCAPASLDLAEQSQNVLEKVEVTNGNGRVIRIADTKTRVRKSLPPESQRLSTYYQLLLYRRLFSDMVEGKFDFPRFAQSFKLDINAELSSVFQRDVLLDEHTVATVGRECEERNRHQNDEYFDLLGNLRTLNDVWRALQLKLSEFSGKISDQMSVTYVYQGDGELFAGIDFTFREAELQKMLDRSFSYWRGERDPAGVEVDEAYKCRSCTFSDRCLWRLEKIRESTERNREQFQRAWKNNRSRAQPGGQLVVERIVE